MFKKNGNRPVNEQKLYRGEYIGIYLFLLPCVLVFAVFYVYPILEVFITSFTKWNGYGTPEFRGLRNYARLFQDSGFLISLKNFLYWSVLAVIIHVPFGVLVAFILYQKPFGWKFTRMVFMAPNIISAAAWAIIYKFFFNNDFGMLNSVIRVFAPEFSINWLFTSPYAFWAVTITWLFYSVLTTLFIQGDLMAIPGEIHEAAQIDGATRLQTILKIDLPLCRISLGTSIIMAVSGRIGMYEQIKLTTAGGPGDDTMSMAVMMVDQIMASNYGRANAIAVLMILMGIITLAVVQKLFRMNESIY